MEKISEVWMATDGRVFAGMNAESLARAYERSKMILKTAPKAPAKPPRKIETRLPRKTYAYSGDFVPDEEIDMPVPAAPIVENEIAKPTKTAGRPAMRFLTHNGETKSIAEWARLYKINRVTLMSRIYRLGWQTDKALLTPVHR